MKQNSGGGGHRGYRTLPSAFRRSDESRKSGKTPSSSSSPPNGKSSSSSSGSSEHTPLFGLNLNLSSLISGGMQFFGQLGRKKNASVTSPPPRSSSASDRLTTSTSVPKDSRSAASEALHSFSVRFGTSAATSACVSELIEMSSFQSSWAEGEQEQAGLGHVFKAVGTFNPTWCDLCRDLIWGLYDTGASRCIQCHLTCHLKCQSRIKLNCASSFAPLLQDFNNASSSSSTSSADDMDKDESTLANISTLKDEEYEGDSSNSESDDDEYKTLSAVDDLTLDEGIDDLVDDDTLHSESPNVDLTKAIACYNQRYPPGQETTTAAADCRGYIRVLLNLRRPIHVLPGTRPPSIYNLTSATLTENNRTLTSFYLPQDTVKALHLTSLTSAYDVIRSLLSKFRVVDNPHKFALYEDKKKSAATEETSTMGRQVLRKMSDEEKPLLLALSRCLEEESETDDCCYFVLQENDPGEICWESFSMPELKNFLLILDREEAWYKRRIHEKYEFVHQTMQAMLEQKVAEENGEESSQV